MKIVHSSGKAYQLAPDTQIEIERPNLFFNNYGEQSLPVDLPDTDLNRELTGYPDMVANRKKPQTDITCSIRDGDYCVTARQAILGAKRKEKITTTFYMNEGSFLSRIEKVAVPAVFGRETVPGVETVEQGISWCRSLLDNTNPHFTLFPVIIELDGEKRGVNLTCVMDENGRPMQLRPGVTRKQGLYNSYARTEKVDSRIITLDPGYYITPFIRATYLLERIFSYFGYTLQPNFFTETEPFKSMVFINNTADALVNGTILLAHLVPDCLCSTLLEVFRKKFCCEFVPDEVAKTVRIEFFKDMIAARNPTDLTPCLAGQPEINYETARQLKLSSKSSLSNGSTLDSTTELERKYPTAYYDMASGRYVRMGYGREGVIRVVSDGNLPFYAGEEGLDDYEVEVPDSQFCFDSLMFFVQGTINGREYGNSVTAPYIGEGRMLNSTIRVADESTKSEESEETTSDPYLTETSHDQNPMLAFALNDSTGLPVGANHDAARGYSLLYNGPIGIYEKFWRDFDTLLRNALHKVTVPLLMTNTMKQALPVYRKVALGGSEYLIDVLKYTLGGNNMPMDTTLLTTQLQEPVTMAMDESERMKMPAYKWKVNCTLSEMTEVEWTAAGFEAGALVDMTIVYLAPPTEKQYAAGGQYHKRTDYYSYMYYPRRGEGEICYRRVSVYMTPQLITD